MYRINCISLRVFTILQLGYCSFLKFFPLMEWFVFQPNNIILYTKSKPEKSLKLYFLLSFFFTLLNFCVLPVLCKHFFTVCTMKYIVLFVCFFIWLDFALAKWDQSGIIVSSSNNSLLMSIRWCGFGFLLWFGFGQTLGQFTAHNRDLGSIIKSVSPCGKYLVIEKEQSRRETLR